MDAKFLLILARLLIQVQPRAVQAPVQIKLVTKGSRISHSDQSRRKAIDLIERKGQIQALVCMRHLM